MLRPTNLISKKLASDSYLRSTLVLAIDMVVSLVSSGLIVLFAEMLELGGTDSPRFALAWLLAAFIGSLLGFLSTRSYEGVIRHSTLRELAVILEATIEKELIIFGVSAIFLLSQISIKSFWILPAIDFLVTMSFLVMVRISMVLAYDFLMSLTRPKQSYSQPEGHRNRVLVYGTGDKSISLSTRFANSPHYEVQGYLTRNPDLHVRQLNGKPIYQFSDIESLVRVKDKSDIQGIMFPIQSDVKKEENGLVEFARHINLRLYVAPTVDEIKEDADIRYGMRTIRIEDLLGREEIEISLDEVKAEVKGKTVLVTGAAGSIGSELCRQLAKMGARRLILFDNAETPLHTLRLEFEDKYRWVEAIPVIGDVRALERVDYVFRDFCPDLVFHAAAYKHVPLMEENPCEAVMANVEGSRNVADKCVEYGVKKMVMVSTDKAVNPTNIMGCTKRIAEIYVQSLGLAIEKGEVEGSTCFVTTRFGNVLGSNGSVIPRFKEQIEMGGPVTVTHPEIRRFFMTIPEACRLVMEAAILGKGTHIFAFDMGEPVKIAELASRMIHLAGFEVDKDIKIVYSGLRPGEKLYEEVLADKENTEPTSHKRIFKAKVRQYSYADAREAVDRLVDLAKKVEIMQMVALMKTAVPEFKSKHSVFEKLDRPDDISENR